MSELLHALGRDIAAYFYPMDYTERLLVWLVLFTALVAVGAVVNYAIRANERQRILTEMRRHSRATMKATVSHKG